MAEFRRSKLHQLEMKRQIIWRKQHISTQEYGIHCKDKVKDLPKKYPHIVPFDYWQETLYRGIRSELLTYIKVPGKEISTHDGVHNLLSSWVLCANLYFMTKTNTNFRSLILDFLKLKIAGHIDEIIEVELEFAFPEGDELNPKLLLGETTGKRGKKQTSPDVAFLIQTKDGKQGIILTEVKYTEHHFYGCSTNPIIAKYKGNNLNPDFSRCMKSAKGYDYKQICHQKQEWKRKYMDLIAFSAESEKVLQCCPASTDGYQLFRQQALAEGISKSGNFDLVASTVAFDERNDDLINCMKTTGVNDFQTDWAPLYVGETTFKTWTHQEWVQFVRDNQKNGEFEEWLEYVNGRYGY